MTSSRLRGLLELVGIVAFGLLVGAFVMSLFVPQSDPHMPPQPALQPSDPGLDRSGVRVEVRNGSGVSGAAGAVTSRLRDEGFDVVDYGNADHFQYEKTRVIDRVGVRRRAAAVAAVFGLSAVEVNPDSSLLLDVTVILGADRVWAPQPVEREKSPSDRLWSWFRRWR